ncbi:sulfate adenylyltransferase [Mitosporidium daphniae]|uniref:Sulfate adenylyltransferase n=1 Tax=Mitosporidium daphniae TaxID=1485682 RepID=A0A098VUK8_9MICR|nr:sulfate adenylyltransferase [Mitosporidium daphniae]KGG52534.1 sulfate adenylyltransferase [Mitosporidium daphniae]|eukprot:XP_013239007.1 sulfate adenylyltransferase [Mitosporidium daphniae]
MEIAGRGGAFLDAIMRKNYACTKFIVERDHMQDLGEQNIPKRCSIKTKRSKFSYGCDILGNLQSL